MDARPTQVADLPEDGAGRAAPSDAAGAVMRAALGLLSGMGADAAQAMEVVDGGVVRAWSDGAPDPPPDAVDAALRVVAAGTPVHVGNARGEPVVVRGRIWGAVVAVAPDPDALGRCAAALPHVARVIGAHLAEAGTWREAGRRSRLILDSIAEGVYGVDMSGRATFINPAAQAMLGWSADEFVGLATHPLVHHSHADGSRYPAEECTTVAAMRDGTVCHVDHEVFWRADGSFFPVTYTTTPMLDGGEVVGAVVTFRDITEHRRAHDQARTDVLTGLPNLRAFREAFDEAVARVSASGGGLALVLFDVDRFKRVNDAHGHLVGDEVLIATAAALARVARAGDAVARLGGEEFGWLLPGLDAPGAVAAAERAREHVAAVAHPTAGRVTISAGVAGWEPDVHDPGGTLFRAADAALYRAKALGRDRVCGPPHRQS